MSTVINYQRLLTFVIFQNTPVINVYNHFKRLLLILLKVLITHHALLGTFSEADLVSLACVPPKEASLSVTPRPSVCLSVLLAPPIFSE